MERAGLSAGASSAGPAEAVVDEVGSYEQKTSADGDGSLAVCGKDLITKHCGYGDEQQACNEGRKHPASAVHLVAGTEGKEPHGPDRDREAAVRHIVSGHLPQDSGREGNQYRNREAMNEAKRRQSDANEI